MILTPHSKISDKNIPASPGKPVCGEDAGMLRFVATLRHRRLLSTSSAASSLTFPMLSLVTLMCLNGVSSLGQVSLSGVVVDSASMAVLPYVNVTVKRTGSGTASNLKGAF